MGTIQSKKLESFRGGNFPDAAGTSQFKKMESFSAGNFPIQMDGFFLRWELPAALSWLSRPPAALFLEVLAGKTGGFSWMLPPSSISDSISSVPTFRRRRCLPKMGSVEALRQAIEEKKVLVVVGSGVSVAATGGAECASWPGLLRDGIAWCEGHRQGLPAGWGDRGRASLASGDLDEMLAVASQVEAKLRGGEFRDWLKSSVGALRVQHPELIESIWALGCPVATTNYDDLLRHDHLERMPWTWLQHAQVLSWARKERSGVFHFHGHWDFPESIVLDPRSYERNLLDDSAQAVLQALGTVSSFLYIGCGEGLSDPHFESFRDWLRTRFAGSGFHYRLCLEKEAAELERRHAKEGMRVVSYGETHIELTHFLRSLVAGSSSAPKPPSVSTTLLPGRPVCFGREKEVEILVAAFCAEPPEPVVVVGGAGMGKSTITLEALHDPPVRKRFGTRRFFVRCDGAKGREGLVDEIARTLGLKHQGNVPLEHQICDWLEASQALLVLDNAETPWEIPEENSAVEELFGSLASVPGLALVVSARGEQFPGGVRWGKRVRVGPLSPEAAREVFLEIAGPDFPAERGPLDRLLHELEYWALPINLLAHQAQSEPNLANLAKRWKDERIKVLERAGGKNKLTSLTTSLEMSYTSPRLSEGARRLLGLLGCLPDGISPEDLPALMPDGSPAAALLRQAGLVVRDDLRIRVLAPIREWLVVSHPPEPAVFQRAVDHYVGLACLGEQVGWKDGALASTRLLAEFRNLEAMVAIRLRQPDPRPGIQAAYDLAKLSLHSGWGTPQLLQEACNVAEQSGDQLGKANCLWRLGELTFRRQIEPAQELWVQARTLYQRVGKPLGEAHCLSRLGDLAFRRSQSEPARELWEQARKLYQQVGDPMGEADCLWRLGDLGFRQSQDEAARELWEQARTHYQQAGDPQGEARCLWSLGDLAFWCSQDERARELWEQARTFFQQVGDPLGEANCLLSLGEVAQHSSVGNTRSLYEEALALYQQIQAPYSIAIAHQHLARISDEPERSRHVQTARDIWTGQDLPTMVGMLDREFSPPTPQPTAKPKRRRKK
jgi:tetratricopeptide (TPR) repeat protein